jgi:hypothetical protein
VTGAWVQHAINVYLAKTAMTVCGARFVRNLAVTECTETLRRRDAYRVIRCVKPVLVVEKRLVRAVWRDCHIPYLNVYPHAVKTSIGTMGNAICVTGVARRAKEQLVKIA